MAEHHPNMEHSQSSAASTTVKMARGAQFVALVQIQMIAGRYSIVY